MQGRYYNGKALGFGEEAGSDEASLLDAPVTDSQVGDILKYFAE